MSENVDHKLWPGRSLDSTTVRLQTYACESLEVVGSATVQVGYEGRVTVKARTQERGTERGTEIKHGK